MFCIPVRSRFQYWRLCKCRELEGLFTQFEISWNAVRGNVERYECKELTVPVMNRNVPLAMCLVEPRDQGLYIIAIFEYLRNLQNSFLDAVISLGFNNLLRTRQSSQPASIHIQNCKVSTYPSTHHQSTSCYFRGTRLIKCTQLHLVHDSEYCWWDDAS
jgi:hypothetical protein